MSTKEVDGAVATMISADPAALHAVACEATGESPAFGEEPRSPFARLARLLNPGQIVCDLVGAESSDDRTVLRMFVNLGVYAKVAMLVVLAVTD